MLFLKSGSWVFWRGCRHGCAWAMSWWGQIWSPRFSAWFWRVERQLTSEERRLWKENMPVEKVYEVKDLGLVLWYGEPVEGWGIIERAQESWCGTQQWAGNLDRLNCGLLKMKHGWNVVVVDSACELMLQPSKVICGGGQCCGTRTAALMACLIRI